MNREHSGPPIDDEVIDELRTIGSPGEPSLLVEMIDLYLEDSVERLTAVREAHGAGDADGLAEAAHALKGSSSNFGAHELQRLCRDLVLLGRTGHVDRAEPKIEAVEREFERVKSALEKERARG
jgi:HPt (histidine-containing phosphotransfer) domain-containing protein